MSTIGLESWAVDLAEVGAVYPFQGAEVLMVIIGVVLWIAWHIWQLKNEARELETEVRNATKEKLKKSIDNY